MQKITYQQFLDFRINYYTTGWQYKLRLGQAFLNNFFPMIPDDELFYCEDTNKSYEIICEKYVNIPEWDN